MGMMVDHTGLPVFVLVAGILVGTGHLTMPGCLAVCLATVFAVDAALYFLGRYLSGDRAARPGLHTGLFGASLVRRLLNRAESAYERDRYWLHIACPLIPVVGKYVPLVAGYARAPWG